MTFTGYNNIIQNKIFCFNKMLNGKLANLEQQSHERLDSFSFLLAFFLFLPKEKEKSGSAFFAAMAGVLQFIAGVVAIGAAVIGIGAAVGINISPIQVAAAITFAVLGIVTLGFGFAAAGIALSLASPEFAKAVMFIGVSVGAIIVGIMLLPLGPVAFILGCTLIGFGIGSAVGYLSGGLSGFQKNGKWDQDAAESRWVSYGTLGAVAGFSFALAYVLIDTWGFMKYFTKAGHTFAPNLINMGSTPFAILKTLFSSSFWGNFGPYALAFLGGELVNVFVLNGGAAWGMFNGLGERANDTMQEDSYGHRGRGRNGGRDFTENKFPTSDSMTNAIFWAMFMPLDFAIVFLQWQNSEVNERK